MEADYLIASESVIFIIALICFSLWVFLSIRRNTRFKKKSFIGFLSIGLFFVLFMRTFIVEPFIVPTSSMAPTVLEKDIVLVNKNAYGIKWPFFGYDLNILERKITRGDIVVFKFFDADKKEIFYLKRVVGLPGDVVTEVNGLWYVNGVSLNEKTTNSLFSDVRGGQESQNREIFIGSLDRNDFKTLSPHKKSKINLYRVPSRHFFVLGDNRGLSYDSRNFGFIPFSKILGPAEIVLFNLSGNDRNFKNLYEANE